MPSKPTGGAVEQATRTAVEGRGGGQSVRCFTRGYPGSRASHSHSHGYANCDADGNTNAHA